MTSATTNAVEPTDSHRGEAIVTGGNAGIGYQTALGLLQHGFSVTLAVRDRERGRAASERLADEVPDAAVAVAHCDLASLDSVAEFAQTYRAAHPHWSALVNNAGAKIVPDRILTDDGFEWHFGVNHLGHFALTGLLLPAASHDARIVTMTSLTYRSAMLRFHDLRWDNGYRPGRAYGMSKLANLMFAQELARRIDDPARPAYPSDLESLAVHPGFTAASPYGTRRVQVAERVIAQSAAQGAETSIAAATASDAHNGAFIVPSGPGQLRGTPKEIEMPTIENGVKQAARLWRISCQLTGVTW